MKTVIQTLLWKRPEISRIHFDNLKESGLDVYVGVSEDWAAKLCEEYGFKYVMTENQPLGRKKAQTIELALQDDWDYLLELGSDCLLMLDRLNLYLKKCKGNDAIGTKGAYVAEPRSKRAGFFKYRTNNVMGAGRVFKRECIEKNLWSHDRVRGLDGDSLKTLLSYGYTLKIIDDVILCDFKTETNMNSYAQLINSSLTHVDVDFRNIMDKFPNQKKALYEICMD